MSNKSKKIAVDILMLAFFALSLIGWEIAPIFHIVAGTVFAVLLSIHVYLNREWIVSLKRNFEVMNANVKVKLQYIVNMLLLIFWSISIITGVLAFLPYFGAMYYVPSLGNIHAVTARLGCILILIHICQNLGQIRSYIKTK